MGSVSKLRTPVPNEIELFFQCAECLKDRPEGMSPQDYQYSSTGWTEKGLQVWCIRHEINIVHIDFEGHVHPAVTTIYE